MRSKNRQGSYSHWSQRQDREGRHSSPNLTDGLIIKSSDKALKEKNTVIYKHMAKEPGLAWNSREGFSEEVMTEPRHEEIVE